MRVEIVKEVNRHLRQTWMFHIFDLNIVFIKYKVEQKPPRKRKWTIIELWDKYGRRHDTMIEEPVVQEHIKREALEKVQNMLKVLTWEEWKNPK